MLKLSKTMFKSYIRCERYAALDELYMKKNDAVIAFSEDATIEDLMSYEVLKKKQDLLKDMKLALVDEFQEEDDIEEELDEPIFQDDFDELEAISARKIEHMFGGEVIASKDTYKQKRFSYAYQDHELYCFLDAYQEDENTVRICEVKATTSSKFLKLKFKRNKDDLKESIFYESKGVYYLKDTLEDNLGSEYNKKIDILKNRITDTGRYIYDLAYQMFVVSNQGIQKHTRFILAIINHEYVYDGKKDSLGNPVYDDDIIRLFDFTSLVLSMYESIKGDIHTVIRRMDTLDASEVSLGKHCEKSKPMLTCPFVGVCYKHIPEDYSVFNYMQRHHGYYDQQNVKHEFFDLLNEGMTHARDLDERYFVSNKYDGSTRIEKNKIQREVILNYLDHNNETPFVRKDEIKEIINHLNYPLYHLDFESLPSPLPKHKGEKPYAQSLFQFSIHIETSPGVCDYDDSHIGFLASSHNDERHKLVKALIETIQDDGGHIIVWNQTFEKGRLEELAKLFPMYKDRLDNIVSRLYDLMKLFSGDKNFHDDSMFNFYHHKLKHSYSIKKVLPVFSTYSHEDLEVKHGGMAMETFKKYPTYDQETFKKKYEALIKYCQLDTFAMVEILDGARKLV
jgi:hypothetical protein